MQEEIQPDPAVVPVGGLLRLRAREGGPITWLGPTWAVLCGVVASAAFTWQMDSWIRLALLLLLVDAGWGSLWAALGASNWAAPLRSWRRWSKNKPTAALPYTRPDAPGGRLRRFLGRLRAWSGEVLWPRCGPALLTILAALPVTALLAALLGLDLLLLTAAALAVMQLGALSKRDDTPVPPGWDAIVAVALPWLAGHVAFGPPTLRSAGFATLFALAWGQAWSIASRWGRVLTITSQLLTAGILIALRRPFAAGALLLILVPQSGLLPWAGPRRQPNWYVRHARPWMMAAMMIAALAV